MRNVELMRLLLGMGANAHALSAKSRDKYNGGFHRPGDNNRIFSPLQAFSKSGGDFSDVTLLNGLEMLLDAGLDPNTTSQDGLTVLHNILGPGKRGLQQENKSGVENALSLLFDRGLLATPLTQDGSNALHLASNISSAVIEMLTSRGVDINHVNNAGKTPLIASLERRDLITVQHLLDQGADANIRDDEFNSSLHLMAKVPRYQLDLGMVKALIAAGADVNGTNKDHNTPMHMAMQLGDANLELLNTFLEYGFNLENKNKLGHSKYECSL